MLSWPEFFGFRSAGSVPEAEAGRPPAVGARRRFLFNRDAVSRVLSERTAEERVEPEDCTR